MKSERLAVLTAALLALAQPSIGIAQTAGSCGSAYTVRQGDTMTSVAARCGSSVDALLEANPDIADPARISVGMELTVPGRNDAAASAKKTEGQEEISAARLYTVEAGDSFARIASRLGVPLSDLIAANQSVDPQALRPGQELVVPGDDTAPSAPGEDAAAPDADDERPAGSAASDASEAEDPTAAAAAGRYTVEAGDSFARIASRLGVPLADLIAANRSVDPRALRPGQELVLPGGDTAATAAGEDAAAPDPDAEQPAESGGTGAGRESVAAAPGLDDAAEPEPERLVLEGRIRKGEECPVLMTPDGQAYSLVSQTYGFTPGDYVAIEGESVEMSFCTSGQTVRVTSMRGKPAPRGG